MSLKKSIDDNCKECSYSEGSDGTWRNQVVNCRGVSCASYNVRPLEGRNKHEVIVSRRKAVDNHCKTCIYDHVGREAKGSWRAQTKACTSKECNLWSERPLPLAEGRIEVKEVK